MSQYLLVYRSAVADKLFWGLDDKDNTMLKLATVKANLTEFPAGCVFEVCSGAVALLLFVTGQVLLHSHYRPLSMTTACHWITTS